MAAKKKRGRPHAKGAPRENEVDKKADVGGGGGGLFWRLLVPELFITSYCIVAAAK